MVTLRQGERIEDLQFRGLKVIQNPESFCFGTDAVLLAGFASVRRGSRIADLGTGTGILPLLLYGRHSFAHCDAIELQPDMADMASRSMVLNGLEEKISVHTGDLCRVKEFLPCGAYATVVCNPPYQKAGGGEQSKSEGRAISRHEAACTLEDVCRAASYLLKFGGRLSVVLRADRISELFSAMRAWKLEPKRLRAVQARAEAAPYIILAEAVKEGKPFVQWEPTLCLYDEAGNLSRETNTIYHREDIT